MTKIMLVEDDANLQSIYGDRLTAEGHTIISARDGEEALSLAMKEKPDLIISDIMMPKISGFDMLDILRTTPETKNIKIIMMTALSQAEDKERADKLGADKYLVKSQVTLDDVARVVNEVSSQPAVSSTTEGTPATPGVIQMPPAPTPQANEPTVVNEPVVAAPEEPTALPSEPSLAPAMPASMPVPSPDPTPVVDPPAPTQDPVPDTPPAVDPLQANSAAPAEPPVSQVNQPPTPTADPATTDSVSSAEEQAVISSQIDEFLAKNLPDTPTHTAEGASPSLDAPSAPQPAPTAQAIEESPPLPHDEAIMDKEAPTADLMPSVDGIIPPPVITAQPPAAQLKDTPAPVTENPVENPPVPEPPAAKEEPKKTAGERVIQPLGDPGSSKPNIMDLYDKEVAKEIADAPIPTPPTGSVIDEPTSRPVAQEQPQAPNDPHAIAL